jgi:plastocyanin
VRFTNSETAIHNVNINDEDVSGTMERDYTFEWSPPGTGEYEVRCDFHPQMRATITVE